MRASIITVAIIVGLVSGCASIRPTAQLSLPQCAATADLVVIGWFSDGTICAENSPDSYATSAGHRYSCISAKDLRKLLSNLRKS